MPPTVAAILAAFFFALAVFLVARAPRRHVVSSTALARAVMQRTAEERLLWNAAVPLKCAANLLDGELRTRIEAIVRLASRRVPLRDAMAAQLFVMMIEKALADTKEDAPYRTIDTGCRAQIHAALRHAEALARMMSKKAIQRATEVSRVA